MNIVVRIGTPIAMASIVIVMGLVSARIGILRWTLAWALVAGVLMGIIGLFAFDGLPTVSAQSDTTVPTISSVAITSDTGDDDSTFDDDGVYGIDDSIKVTVTFSENVTVTGAPQLELDIGGSGKATAYESVTTTNVVFSYTVEEGVSDDDGIAIGTNKLTLNGGSIKDAADNAANLSHDALSAQEDHQVDGVRPWVIRWYIIEMSQPNDEVFTIGDLIWTRLDWSETVSIRGNPQLTLDFDGTSKTSTYTDGWEGHFSEYTVVEGDSAPDGVAIPANAISLNGGSIKDRAGNDAVLTHSAVSADSLTADLIPADGIRPTITSIEIISDPGDDDTYAAGDAIIILATFSENLDVADLYDGHRKYQTTIELNIGGEARTAVYFDIQDTRLYLAYTVQAGDTDADGISIGANKMWNGPLRPSGTLYTLMDRPNPRRWGRGNPADVSHDAIADDSGHKVSGGALSPVTLSGNTRINYAENGTSIIPGEYTLPGSDNAITWSLSGDDSEDFSLAGSAATRRQLKFTSSPNYEAPTDADTDNRYDVTIRASDGTNTSTLQVTVFVTNVPYDADEVPFITGTPQVGETLTADISNITPPENHRSGPWYFWFRSDGVTDTQITADYSGDISEISISDYTLTDEDVGGSIKVKVNLYGGPLSNDFVSRMSEPTALVAARPNSSATGVPVISGTVQVGETLTASTSGIADADGLTNVSYSYQWIRNDGSTDTDIENATGASYAPVDADEGKTIKVKVSFTDDAGNDEALTSPATAEVDLATAQQGSDNTEATGRPSISGTAQVGETLTASTSGIADADGLTNVSYSYLWVANGRTSDSDIADATGTTTTLTVSDTYTVPVEDVGKTIKVKVSFTDDAGNEESLTSSETAEVTATWKAILTVGSGENSGTAFKGYSVFADGVGGLTPRQFLIGEEQYSVNLLLYSETTLSLGMSGNIGTGFVLHLGTTTFDLGDSSTRQGTNAYIHSWSDVDLDWSEADTVAVALLEAETEEASGNSPATGAPTISGTAQVEETLTSSTSGIADTDGLTNVSYSYQWIRNDGSSDTDIQDATGSSYTLVDADEGKTIKVKVSFTDDRGNDATLTSAATEAVEPAGTEPTDRPYGLTATVSVDDITLTWQEPDNFYGPDYHILRHRPEEGEPDPLVYVDFTGTDATTFTDTDVEPGVLYVYQVRATIDLFATLGEPSDPIEARVPERETSDTEQASNTPATGVPVISGTAQVEETLTASTSGIADADGLTNVSYSYQWIRNDGSTDTDIQDATGSTYSLVDADEGQTIKVKVSFTDDAGNEETLTSAATASAAARPNSPATGSLTVSGVLRVGQTLTVDLTSISDEDGMDTTLDISNGRVYTYNAISWSVNGEWTGRWSFVPTYPVRPTDAGKAVTAQWQFMDDRGTMENVVSAPTATIEATVPDPIQNLEVSTSDPGALNLIWEAPTWDILSFIYDGALGDGGSPITGYKVQWKEADDSWKIGADVSEETVAGTSHTITGLTGGVEYTVRVIAINGIGEGSASSEENSIPTGPPTISGTVQVGETLTADTSDISDSDGLTNVSFSYQWIRNDGTSDSDISSATSSAYTLVDSDEGKTIKVEVSFTDDAGNDETLTSVATAAVAARPNSPATGTPTISGTAQVGETLTASTSGISDADGLTNVSYSYQWIRNDGSTNTDIQDATGSTYSLVDADEGQTIKVRVSFSDDAGHDETLTSAATSEVAAAPSLLTVSLESSPASHHGTDAFTFQIRFSEEFKVSYRTLRDHAFTVDGGVVTKATRQVRGSNIGWTITVEPDSNAAVRIVVHATTDCDATGAICTADGRKLSNSLDFTVSGPS